MKKKEEESGDKTDKEKIEIQKKEYEEKLEKYKKEVVNGSISEIPKEMKVFKPKKVKPNTLKSFKKVNLNI